MHKIERTPIIVAILLFCLGLPVLAFAEVTDPCAETRSKLAWDSRQDPVYSDATELGQKLNVQGIITDCIRASKMENFFEGQKGAAWFKTNQGIFEVLFLPKPKNFSKLEITLKLSSNERFVYLFRGEPPVHVQQLDSSNPGFFIKNENMLFVVWGDGLLAKNLSAALQNK